MNRKLTARGEQRRADLIALATRRFAEKGYHPTSVAELVEGLGVGKGVFYWYFSSKEELFRAILKDAQVELRRAQRTALQGAGDPLAQIAAGIRASVHWTVTWSGAGQAGTYPDMVTESAAAFRVAESQALNSR